MKRLSIYAALILGIVLCLAVSPVKAQLGNSGSIEGVVKDQSGGVVIGATVEISNPVTGFQRQETTASDGTFRFSNVPVNPSHLTATAAGLAGFTQDVDVRSTVPINLQIGLKVGAAEATVRVEAKG